MPIKKKLMIYSCLLVLGTVLISTGATSILIYKQTRNQNRSRLEDSTEVFQRVFIQDVTALEHCYRDFANNVSVIRAILNSIKQDVFYFPALPELFSLGRSIQLERFAFYFPRRLEGSNILQMYYDKTLEGIVRVNEGSQTLNRQVGDLIVMEKIESLPPYPQALTPSKKYSLGCNGANVMITGQYDYTNLSETSSFSPDFKQGARIGVFILEKPMSLALSMLDEESGVYFNVYDISGRIVGGRVDMTDLDIKTDDIASEKLLKLVDKDSSRYDSLVVPLFYKGRTIGYVSASIPQSATIEKIISTVRVLFGTAVIILFSIAFVSFIVVSRETRSIRQLTESASAIAKGDLDRDIEIKGSDELATLSQGFMDMRDAIRKQIAELNREIAERKQIEKERARLATAIDQAAESVIIASKPGTIQYVNPSFERLSGYTQAEIIGRNFRILRSDQHDEAFYRDMYDIISHGKIWAGRITNQMKDGTLRQFETRISPVRDSSGEIINFVSVNRDITQEVELEAKLQRAQKMETLGLLAGGVAHDLNNILSGIVSYPDLLLMDLPENSPLRRPIEIIKESGSRAAEIVSDLMTITKGVATVKETLNLNTLIEEYRGSAEQKKLEKMHPDVTFQNQLDSELLNISCSPVHIKKILMNLVSNAAESIEGRGNIIVSTINRYLDKPLKGYENIRKGEYAVLTVSDNGSGISPNDLERIFEPFYTKKFMGRSGTGLGLAVVWNTIQDHDGYIDVKSSKEGTIFELYFPITRDELITEKEQTPFADYVGFGERILVVDDEENQREIACGLLAKLGYSAEAVSSGEDAIEYLKEHSVDLIVLDMIMPKGINGRETYEEIIKINPKQKVIIASGYAETLDVKKAQELGAGKYVKKPYTLEKIGIAVRDELKK